MMVEAVVSERKSYQYHDCCDTSGSFTSLLQGPHGELLPVETVKTGERNAKLMGRKAKSKVLYTQASWPSISSLPRHSQSVVEIEYPPRESCILLRSPNREERTCWENEAEAGRG